MFVRMLSGPYKDKVREIVFDAAQSLIESGQAIAVDFNAGDAQQQMVAPASPAAPAAEASARRIARKPQRSRGR